MTAVGNAPEVVVGLYIINNRSEIFLIRGRKFHDRWIVPGGHVEFGESMKHAAKREALEETGMRVRPEGVFKIVEDVVADYDGGKRHFVFFEVLCRPLTTRVKLDRREASDGAWFDLTEATRVIEHRPLKRVVDVLARSGGSVDMIDVWSTL